MFRHSSLFIDMRNRSAVINCAGESNMDRLVTWKIILMSNLLLAEWSCMTLGWESGGRWLEHWYLQSTIDPGCLANKISNLIVLLMKTGLTKNIQVACESIMHENSYCKRMKKANSGNDLSNWVTVWFGSEFPFKITWVISVHIRNGDS